MEARLAPVLREENIPNLDELLRKAETGDRRLQQRIIDALTTNETFFFRDRQPFDHFRDVIMPELHQRRARRRPSASGVRPAPRAGAVLAGDAARRDAIEDRQPPGGYCRNRYLRGDPLEGARGLFNQFEVQRGLPTKLLLHYFTKQGDNWKISDNVVRRVNFQKFNLMDEPRALGTFDAIFCRNVLIYFDRRPARRWFDKLASRLAPDGFLLLGGAESTFGVTERFVSHSKERMLLVPAPAPRPEPRLARA